MTPAIYIAPDAELTERQQSVFLLLIDREAGDFRTLRELSRELGDVGASAIYDTLRALERKGLVVEAEYPWFWRVKWIHRPAVYVRQGRRNGWVLEVGPGGEPS